MRKTLLFVLLFLCVLSASAFAGTLQETIILQQQQTTGAPTITSLSPTSTATGGPSFTLTVNGTGFINGDVVIFNSQRRATTFVSATQLTATILAADIVSPGTAFVTVSHPFGTTSNTATFTITATLPGGTTLYFAQIAEGIISRGFYKTTFILVNPTTGTVTATIEFFDPSGTPLSLALETQTPSPATSVTVTIPPGSQVTVRTAGTRTAATGGWARVTSAGTVAGFVLYDFFNASGTFVAEAGQASSPLATHFFVPVEFSGTNGFETAVALVNPSSTLSSILTLTLRSSTGTIVATFSVPLPPGAQFARFLREGFPGLTAPFQGTVEVVATVPVAATSLRTLGGLQSGNVTVTITTSTLPIVVVEDK